MLRTAARCTQFMMAMCGAFASQKLGVLLLLGFGHAAIGVFNMTQPGTIIMDVKDANGFVLSFAANPARWNAWHGSSCSSTRCPAPSAVLDPGFAAALGPLHLATDRQGCDREHVTAAQFPGAVLLARRGGCTFQTKVEIAAERGYCGVVVYNRRSGLPPPRLGILELPDMSVGREADEHVAIPGWLISKDDGLQILGLLSNRTVTPLTVKIMEQERKVALWTSQADHLGVRDYQTE